MIRDENSVGVTFCQFKNKRNKKNKDMKLSGTLVVMLLSFQITFLLCQQPLWGNCETNDDSCIFSDENSNTVCPDCTLVDCFPTLEPRDCPQNTIYMQNILWGCCPACVKFLDYNDICEVSDATLAATTENIPCFDDGQEDLRVLKSSILENTPGAKFPSLTLFQCAPGYRCDSGDTKRCVLDKKPYQCNENYKDYREWLDQVYDEKKCDFYLWENNCSPDGQYSRIQKKSNPYIEKKNINKYCVDPYGNRIFGQATFMSNENDETENEMNCKCSRKVWELEK